jgi:hypothetical protein
MELLISQQQGMKRCGLMPGEPRGSVTEITGAMNLCSKSLRLPSGRISELLLRRKRLTSMTKTEIKNDILTDAELDGVVGGLNPQPLPPSPPPPPEGFLHSFAILAFNRF